MIPELHFHLMVYNKHKWHYQKHFFWKRDITFSSEMSLSTDAGGSSCCSQLQKVDLATLYTQKPLIELNLRLSFQMFHWSTSLSSVSKNQNRKMLQLKPLCSYIVIFLWDRGLGFLKQLVPKLLRKLLQR